MNINKTIFSLTIICCILIIGIPTVFKIINQNHDNLYKVVSKNIEESARRCYIDEKCKEDKITLKMLYEREYLLEEMYDPISKIVYNYESYVDVNNKFTFYPL